MMYRMGYLALALAAAAIAQGTSRAEATGLPGGGKPAGAGERLYMEKCSQCHGDHGDGKGVGAEFFRPLPRDFTSGAFKIRTTESGELPTEADLKSIIKRGMPYTGMPAWPNFSDGELTELARHIKTFNSDFADTSLHPKVIEIPKPPASSEESIKRGKTARTNEPRATAASYDKTTQRIVIELKDGFAVCVPARHIQGLAEATTAQIANVCVSGRGYGLHWPSLDVDMSVLGLMAGMVGTRSHMARLAGQVTSKAKADAARKNGTKGGRPKKGALLT